MRTCENCKYSEPIGGGLVCMGQKWMPFVCPTDSCEDWKTMKQTNADRIRRMTDEELAEFIEKMEVQGYDLDGTFGKQYWLEWLKQEAE